ncbi:MAG: hypothetical protein AAB389_00125 [Patescibacteria group bacterium]
MQVNPQIAVAVVLYGPGVESTKDVQDVGPDPPPPAAPSSG